MKIKSNAFIVLAKAAVIFLPIFGPAIPSSAFSFASYNAGSNGVPAVAPDPQSVAGGSWILNDTTAGSILFLSTNVNPDPPFNNLNVWRTLDDSTAAGQFVLFAKYPTGDEATNGHWCGFKVSAYVRLVDPAAGNSGAASVYFAYGSTNLNRRFVANLDIDANGALTAIVQGSATVVITTNTVDALKYHLHEYIYDSANRTATYRVDGVNIVTNNPGITALNLAAHGAQWGTGPSAGRGNGYFNQVKVEINDLTPTTVTMNPTNLAKGVAESHTFVAAFTGCATNLQWYKNNNPIAGANQRSYTIPNIVPSDSSVYKMGIADPQTGNEVFTTGATLTVNTDTNPPTVVSVTGSLSLHSVRVKFSEGIDPTTAQNPANYQLAGGALSLSAATLLDLVTVDVKTSEQNANSNYNLIISGVQDQSANTMLTVTQAFTAANLVPVTFYRAGTSNNPPVAPSPSSTAGGRWIASGTTNDLVYFAGVSPDADGFFNAWNITDNSTAAGSIFSYGMAFPAESHDFARTNGWRLKVRSRMLDTFGSPGASIVLSYGTPSSRRYLIFFHQVGIDLDLQAQLGGGVNTNVTSGGVGANDYHTHEIVFDPVTQRASYYSDGTLIYSGWNGDANSGSGPIFGAGSSANRGSMNFNELEFSVNNAAAPVIVTNPVSLTNVPFGSTTTFSGFASGFVGGYQWYKDGAAIPGATGKSLTLSSVTQTNEGQYTLRAYNSAVEVESTPATLTVRPMVRIRNTDGNVEITFTGTLQSATNAAGTFADVTPAPTSPLTLTNPPGSALFFRSHK